MACENPSPANSTAPTIVEQKGNYWHCPPFEEVCRDAAQQLHHMLPQRSNLSTESSQAALEEIVPLQFASFDISIQHPCFEMGDEAALSRAIERETLTLYSDGSYMLSNVFVNVSFTASSRGCCRSGAFLALHLPQDSLFGCRPQLQCSSDLYPCVAMLQSWGSATDTQPRACVLEDRAVGVFFPVDTEGTATYTFSGCVLSTYRNPQCPVAYSNDIGAFPQATLHAMFPRNSSFDRGSGRYRDAVPEVSVLSSFLPDFWQQNFYFDEVGHAFEVVPRWGSGTESSDNSTASDSNANPLAKLFYSSVNSTTREQSHLNVTDYTKRIVRERCRWYNREYDRNAARIVQLSDLGEAAPSVAVTFSLRTHSYFMFAAMSYQTDPTVPSKGLVWNGDVDAEEPALVNANLSDCFVSSSPQTFANDVHVAVWAVSNPLVQDDTSTENSKYYLPMLVLRLPHGMQCKSIVIKVPGFTYTSYGVTLPNATLGAANVQVAFSLVQWSQPGLTTTTACYSSRVDSMSLLSSTTAETYLLTPLIASASTSTPLHISVPFPPNPGGSFYGFEEGDAIIIEFPSAWFFVNALYRHAEPRVSGIVVYCPQFALEGEWQQQLLTLHFRRTAGAFRTLAARPTESRLDWLRALRMSNQQAPYCRPPSPYLTITVDGFTTPTNYYNFAFPTIVLQHRGNTVARFDNIKPQCSEFGAAPVNASRFCSAIGCLDGYGYGSGRRCGLCSQVNQAFCEETCPGRNTTLGRECEEVGGVLESYYPYNCACFCNGSECLSAKAPTRSLTNTRSLAATVSGYGNRQHSVTPSVTLTVMPLLWFCVLVAVTQLRRDFLSQLATSINDDARAMNLPQVLNLTGSNIAIVSSCERVAPSCDARALSLPSDRIGMWLWVDFVGLDIASAAAAAQVCAFCLSGKERAVFFVHPQSPAASFVNCSEARVPATPTPPVTTTTPAPTPLPYTVWLELPNNEPITQQHVEEGMHLWVTGCDTKALRYLFSSLANLTVVVRAASIPGLASSCVTMDAHFAPMHFPATLTGPWNVPFANLHPQYNPSNESESIIVSLSSDIALRDLVLTVVVRPRRLWRTRSSP